MLEALIPRDMIARMRSTAMLITNNDEGSKSKPGGPSHLEGVVWILREGA